MGHHKTSGSATPSGLPAKAVATASSLLALIALLALGAAPAQAGIGWGAEEKLGSAEEQAFYRASPKAVNGSGDIYVKDEGGAEQQFVTVNATAGQFKLCFESECTGDLPYNATGTAVREALRELGAIGSSGVSASGPFGTPPRYNVNFSGPLAETDVEQLSCEDGTASLSGGSGCSVETEHDGAVFGLKRFHPNGTPDNFPALGTNLIDGKRTGASNECPTVPADCDEIPQVPNSGGFGAQLAVDRSGTLTDGDIYVAETRECCTHQVSYVYIFSSEGEYLGELTEIGGPNPRVIDGLGVDEDGNLYVATHKAVPLNGTPERRISKYEPSANPPTNADDVFDFPLGFQADGLVAGAGPSDGYIFVSSGEAIYKLDSGTGAQSYEFNGGRVKSVNPVTGHLVAARNDHDAVEWDVSGPEAPEAPVAEAKEANTNSSVSSLPLALADGAEILYIGNGSSVNIFQKVPVPSVVGIDPPLSVSGAKATVAGTVNPDGVEVSECRFEYGKTTSYGHTAPCNETLPEDEEDHEVTGNLSGMLANGVTYHYRLFIKGGLGGQDLSEDETLTTKDTFTTDPATGVAEEEATLNGTVKPEGLALSGCEFEWGPTTDYGHSAECDPEAAAIANDDNDHLVTAALTGLDPSTAYHFRLVAENSLGKLIGVDRSFFTEGSPTIEEHPLEVEQSAAALQAWINPAGAATTYHYEWGPTASYGHRIPSEGEFEAGSGSSPVTVSTEIGALSPVTTYHFRVVAENSFGETVAPDQPFETLNEFDLPDNRGFELVSPADKGSAGAVAGIETVPQDYGPSLDGDSLLYPIQNGIPGSTAGGWTRWQAQRTKSGWQSEQVSAPSLLPAPGGGGGYPSLVLYAPPDLGCAIVQTYNPLTEDTPQIDIEEGVSNLYRRNADGSWDLISNRAPLNPGFDTSRPQRYSKVNTSDDCSRVYFRSDYELIDESSGLYEWGEGTLRDAGVLPDGEPSEELGVIESSAGATVGAEVNSQTTGRENAVTPAGALFFTAISDEGADSGTPAVFLRSPGGGSVVNVSQSETGVATAGARFEAASPDGGRVFFRANYGIAAGATSAGSTGGHCGPLSGETSATLGIEAKPCDLYTYDVATEELTDLSADTNAADTEGAQTQGTVAASEDGSRVYFAALGQLIPEKGRTYTQNTASGSANVYLAHGGEFSYVTTLKAGSGALMHGTAFWTAEASADGETLAFESASSPTAYDSGGYKEAYLYSAAEERVLCVSCRPDRLPRELHVPVEHLFAHPRIESLSDRLRSISADGSRIFFSSPAVLAPGAVPGELLGGGLGGFAKNNIYEWHDGEVSLLAAVEFSGGFGKGEYMGAGESGENVFLATNAQLSPRDGDSAADVYDVRAGGGDEAEAAPVPCQVDEGAALEPGQSYCQGGRSAQPGAGSPASKDATGENVTPRPNPCKARGRRAHRLARQAGVLRRRAAHARRVHRRGAARRYAHRARRYARAARRSSATAKRCRRRLRANRNRGGKR